MMEFLWVNFFKQMKENENNAKLGCLEQNTVVRGAYARTCASTCVRMHTHVPHVPSHDARAACAYSKISCVPTCVRLRTHANACALYTCLHMRTHINEDYFLKVNLRESKE